MNEMEEFKAWADDFSVWDDGYAAFRALKKIEKIRFILALRDGDWLKELEETIEQ